MAKTWYPVIDYLTCTECGTCVSKCPHGVYDTAKLPSPVVRNPEACVDRCHGCGNRCPVGAITYVGDDTGWRPPKGSLETEEGSCLCAGREGLGKKVLVEYLYLDLQDCERCMGTGDVLDKVMGILTPTLQLAGYEVEYKKIEIETEELAKQYRFLSSPTIRVNGQDICVSVKENNCDCCSQISGTNVDCRVFEYHEEIFEVPPNEMLAYAILKTVFGQEEIGSSCGGYELPDNLKRFFDGKRKQKCSCEGSCC